MPSSGSSNQDRLIIGDMNVSVNIVSNNVAQEYTRLLESVNTFVTNTMTTRTFNGNILDHFVCSGQIATKVVNETVFHDLSDHYCPWMTYDLVKVIRIKENTLSRHHRPWKYSNNGNAWACCYRRKLNVKRDYFLKQLERAAWKFVNAYLGKHQKKDTVTSVKMNDQLIADPSHICSAFNDFFCSIGSSLAAKIKSDRNIGKFGTLVPLLNSLYINPTTINEVIILNQNSKKIAWTW